MLLRDDRGVFEVFMVERHHQIDFASSAVVFPGGKVDPADRDPALRARCAGCADLDEETFAVRVAAVRETFEECGVLLARGRGETELLPESRVRPLETRYRSDLLSRATTLGAIAGAHDLELALDAMVPFAHWITPAFMPKRFDTHFYLRRRRLTRWLRTTARNRSTHCGSRQRRRSKTAGQTGDGSSSPTLLNLIKLARSKSVAERDRGAASRSSPCCRPSAAARRAP
jgi:8-oxo-dGTP pyrophosphatase MutT (NUDIX family)